MPAPTEKPETPVWRVLLPPLILALVLWASFGLKLHNLDHTALTRWDEVHHAVVAQNVLKHPLRPTLVDAPYLPYDHRKWGENHVWLHKPILPFWQTALSLAVLGVNAFALRLPAAILSTGAAWLTYLIGKNLLDRRAALVAATLQAVNPFLMTLVHGYQFADNIDIALLFWIEAGIYCLIRSLRTGAWSGVLLAGAAQGLAFLCKSYLAGIILGIGLAAWLLPVVRLAPREDCRIGPLRLLAMLGVSLATVAPWLLWCMLSYPDEFAHEQAQIWRHLGTNVENWEAAWDRVAFDYLIAIYGVFYTPVLVAAIVLVAKATAQRHAGLWLLYAWGLGVIIPHMAAVTKTPSATVIAMPAFLLLLGYLVAEASRWKSNSGWLITWTAILLMALIMPAVVRNPGHGYSAGRTFGAVMQQSMWVIYHLAGAFSITAVLAIACAAIGRLGVGRETIAARVCRVTAMMFCAGAFAWLTMQSVVAAWNVTDRDINDPYSVEAGEFAREHLPEDAVLLCEERKGYEHLTIMFYADRTCYALDRGAQDEMARQIVVAGGTPYIVTRRSLPYVRVYVSQRQGPSVYRWQPAAAN
jgi:4-amino-4-deoxy-L-arabinose transferase-like glycosyltransferase